MVMESIAKFREERGKVYSLRLITLANVTDLALSKSVVGKTGL